ncbi:hypothetical protein [Woodsholea maritima]|uniref:hypothetical protein n=1 Tax=Woodsholea maritima TaxID=240237 RepID=UPI00039B7AC6|nr:hypothetical protein [Woodsholea maritima]
MHAKIVAMGDTRLHAQSIIKALRQLVLRVEERFPTTSLNGVCKDLLEQAERSDRRVRAIARPYMLLRGGLMILVVLGLAGQAVIISHMVNLFDFNVSNTEVFSFVEGVDAALNTLILMGAGIFFLTTVEERIKRRRALSDLHQLRAIAHIIDMHQLTKDPTAILGHGPRTQSSPDREPMTAFQLNRYLDYCSEMLSLTAKLAALYGQSAHDPVIINAVADVENLTTALSRKIWQKIMLINPNVMTGEDTH